VSARCALVLLLLASLLPMNAVAEEVDASRARGLFETASSRLEIVDAYAFRGRSALDGEPVLVVAASNRGFESAEIDEYWDRRDVLVRYFQDDETGLVFFELRADGAVRGYSYDFGPEDGCGWCAGGVESTLRVAGDRIVGTLRQAARADQRSFEVALDVPLAREERGRAQGGGGGAPGRAYLAYDAALRAGDRSAVRALLAAERRATWEAAEADGRGDDFFAYLRSEHPFGSVRVTQAFVRGTRALLLFESEEAGGGRREGEALLALEEGAWRFEEETLRATAR
jgi:hypothetical protein